MNTSSSKQQTASLFKKLRAVLAEYRDSAQFIGYLVENQRKYVGFVGVSKKLAPDMTEV